MKQFRPAARAQDILDSLDRASFGYHGRERRTQIRLPFRRPAVPLQIDHPAGGSLTGNVLTRNVSPGGMSFLIASFVHTGSLVTARLTPAVGPPMRVTGSVVACRYCTAGVHEVSTAFHNKVDLLALLPPEERARAERHADRVRRRLDGVRLLYVGTSAARRDAVLATLQEVGSEVVTADFFGAAVDAVRRANFDLVLCEPRLREGSCADLVPRLRRAGYRGPVMAIDWSAPDLIQAREKPDAGVISAVEFTDADQLLNALPVRSPRAGPSGTPEGNAAPAGRSGPAASGTV